MLRFLCDISYSSQLRVLHENALPSPKEYIDALANVRNIFMRSSMRNIERTWTYLLLAARSERIKTLFFFFFLWKTTNLLFFCILQLRLESNIKNKEDGKQYVNELRPYR